MFKRVYPVVLGVYTILLVSKAVNVTLAEVHGFMSLGFGKMVILVAHNVSTSVASLVSFLI